MTNETNSPEPICRTDGRCQYAIDHGAEGMSHCPKGKCAMPEVGTQDAGGAASGAVNHGWQSCAGCPGPNDCRRFGCGVARELWKAPVADSSSIQGAPTPPADLRDEELFCPQCNGSGEGRAMTTGHGPDDYEYDCPCQLCGGDGSLLKAFQGMQADRDQFRQKYYAALRGYPEKLLTAQELETLELVIEQFADCGETDVDYAVLLDFAQRGYLECEHFTDTPKARAAITAAKEQTK